MKLIEINEKHLVNNKDHQVGPFQKIMILGFEDLEGKNLSMVMLGQSVDLLYVPRKLTEQEMDVVRPSIYNGRIQTGKLIINQ